MAGTSHDRLCDHGSALPLEFAQSHRPPAQWPVLWLSAYAYSLTPQKSLLANLLRKNLLCIPLRDIVTHYPHHYFFTSRKQNDLFFFKQILGVGRQICLKKNRSFSPPARSWRGATRLPAYAYSLLHSLRDIEPHYLPPSISCFPLAEQVVFQADTGSWWANLLKKKIILHFSAGYRTHFDIPFLKGFRFKIFGIGHSSNIRITSGREDHKEAVFFCIFGRTSRLFILGFTEKSDTAVENLISMF